MEQGSDQITSKGSTLQSFLILIFSTTWLVALIGGWLIPRIRGEDSSAAATIEQVRWSTGTFQQWNMFHTIPTLRNYEMELLGETADGDQKRFGVIAPSLEDLNGRKAIRYYYALSRILGDQEFLDGYISQCAEALHDSDPSLNQFYIQAVSEPTRSLDRISEDGEIWTKVTEKFGPYPLTSDGS
ncbi:MAG: hypothetical protein AB8D78_12585 [Akkermansiaceae bacterium]